MTKNSSSKNQQDAQVVILGAGIPFRGGKPSALKRVPSGERVLDWLLQAFKNTLDVKINYVGGYRFEEVVEQYPEIQFSFNADWQHTGSAYSLLTAPLSRQTNAFVCYSDVLFRAETIVQLTAAAGDVVLVFDPAWKNRYASRSGEDLRIAEKVRVDGHKLVAISRDIPVDESSGEYVGLMKLAPTVIDHLKTIRAEKTDIDNWDIPRLVNELLASGFEITVVPIKGDWSELNAPQDMARFVLGTKAESLERLRPAVKKSSIGEQVSFSVGDWRVRQEQILQQIHATFPDKSLIVRSSALSEDSWLQSNAGNFTSLLNIPEGHRNQLVQAIEDVIHSYGDDEPDNQVLVQEMLADVELSGVIFTRTLNNAAPYYTINYDVGTSTDSVTSGYGANLKTVLVHRSVAHPRFEDEQIAKALEAVRELEQLVGYDSLDIEFAIDANRDVHILQVRPIALTNEYLHISDESVEHVLDNAVADFKELQKPPPTVVGRGAIFGEMPDWNPAEIIGNTPRRLAVGLYQFLIMDEVWARQRAEYGYRDVRPAPLLVNFAGHPYVDVRVSFNSFVPASLPDPLAEKLVTHYLDHLREQPHFHDKVEFEIAFTTLYFDFDEQVAERLHPAGFSVEETQALRQGLLAITQAGIKEYNSHFAQIERLSQRFDKLDDAHLDPLERAYVLLHDCRSFGTLPFAHLARSGFIAMTLLRSLVRIGVITNEELGNFLNSINTVTSEFENDGWHVAQGEMEWEAFVEHYGHLRPGTYEITSQSYSEDAERYLRPMVERYRDRVYKAHPEFSWDEKTATRISALLADLGLPSDIEVFDNFLRRVTVGREYAKFVFSRNLSAALDAFVQLGEQYGISREELSHISLTDLLALRTGVAVADRGAWLKERAEEGLAWHTVARATKLPQLITDEEDFFLFQQAASQPNYVTQKKVTATIVNLSQEPATDLNKKIVLIPQADPGFDWLFAREIAGLITMYGGANSHMAIRSAELGLPAAIGVGPAMFEQLCQARVIELDCMGNRVQVVQ